MAKHNSGSASGSWAVPGIFLGALVGYLLRPAALLVGQPPFGAVITRGASLQGLDQLLIPVCQAGFNYMLVGAIIGGFAGAILSHFLKAAKANSGGAAAGE
jgi:hypothetical protein